MAESVLDLGQGLELWRVSPDEAHEQNINARAMPKQMLERLTATIGRDSRLESLPFCARTDNGIEIVSGHHRFRAARAAGMKDLYVLLDVTGLNRDQIRAKQLAHNAIEGRDDESVLRQIYQAIEDAEAKLEAYVDLSMDDVEVPTVEIDNVRLDLDLKSVTINFMPTERERFQEALDRMTLESDEQWLAERKLFEPFIDLVQQLGHEYDIRAYGTILDKMAEIVRQHLGEPPPEDEEVVAVRDLLGRAWIRKGKGANQLKKLVEELRKENAI